MKRLHIPKQYINALVMGDVGLVGHLGSVASR